MSRKDKRMVTAAQNLLKLDAQIVASVVVVISEDGSVDLKSSIKDQPSPQVIYFLSQLSAIFQSDEDENKRAPFAANRYPI